MDAQKSKKSALVAASVAGLLTIASMVALSGTAQAADGVKCYGVNKCKGTGECGGKGHACAGKNACKGQGIVTAADEAACKADGGTLTAPEA